MSDQAIRFKTISITSDCYEQIQSVRDTLNKRLGFNPSTKQTVEMIVKYHIHEQQSKEALKNGAG